jgi:UDP-N-acetylmuramate dehydrogenase
MIVKENYSLKKLNMFGVESSAKYFIEADNETAINEAFSFCKTVNLPVLILGGGSNILFANDFNGIVIKIGIKGIKILNETNEYAIVESFAGELWDDLVTFCVKKEFYGIENLSLIPGTVGAAPIQNIGAYGIELKDVLQSVEGILIDSNTKKVFTNAECKFDYRDSIFNHALKGKYLITKIVLKLSKQKKFNLNYRAFQDYLNIVDKEKITIKDVSELVKEIRTSKLPDTGEYGNAGSFFKNPEISSSEFFKLHEKYPDIVHFQVEKGKFKIPAGWLIEKGGFKGKREGDVGTYIHQALVIINYGNATGAQIISFAEKIQEAVKNKFGIKLIPEVNII